MDIEFEKFLIMSGCPTPFISKVVYNEVKVNAWNEEAFIQQEMVFFTV